MHPQADHAAATTPRRKWRRAVVATTLLGGMLVSGLGLMPSAIMSSSHRDRILNAALKKQGMTATSLSGSGGWLTSFSFRDVSIVDESGRFECTIQSIQLSKSLLSLLTGGHDLGSITLVQPRVLVALDDEGNWPPLRSKEAAATDGGDRAIKSDRKEWDLAFDVQDAGFLLSVPWRELPIVDVDKVDVSGAVATDENGRWLTVQPIALFDHEQLSEIHTEQNLALVAPILSQTTALTGEISAGLDAIRMDLSDPDATPYPIRGAVTLHMAEARLKKEWALQVSQIVGQAIGGAAPTTLRIVENSTVGFEFNEQGIYHDGLAFLLPDLVGSTSISSSGLVGLDESVDLVLSVQLPQMLPRGPFMAALSKMVLRPLELRVTGTVSEPQLSGPGVMDQMAESLVPGTAQTPPPVADSVMKMIGSASSPDRQEAADGITGGILNIIRAAKAARENASPAELRERRLRKRQRKSL